MSWMQWIMWKKGLVKLFKTKKNKTITWKKGWGLVKLFKTKKQTNNIILKTIFSNVNAMLQFQYSFFLYVSLYKNSNS